MVICEHRYSAPLVCLDYPECSKAILASPQKALGHIWNLGAHFWEVDLDSDFSIFGVRRFTEWPGPLH